MTSALLQPTWWEGDGPPTDEPRPLAKSVAASMSSVLAAIQAPTGRLRQWRNRRLT